MKQTIEEAAKEYVSSLEIELDTVRHIESEDIEKIFKAGSRWILDIISKYIRGNTAYNDKAWDILPLIESLKGNDKPLIEYLNNKKINVQHRMEYNIKEQQLSNFIKSHE